MITHIRRSESHGNKTLCGVEAMRFFCADHGDELPTWDSVDDGWCPACLAWHELVDPPKKYIAKDSRAKDRHIRRAWDEYTLCAKPALATYDIAVMSEEASLHPYNWCVTCAAKHVCRNISADTPESLWAADIDRQVTRYVNMRRQEQGPSAASQARDVLNPDNIRRVDRKQPILNDED